MRRSFMHVAVPAIAAGAMLLAACSSGSSDSGSSSAAPESSAAATSAAASPDAGAGDQCGTTIDEIAAKAKEEGKVNLIALPDTWANYRGIIDSFVEKYGIEAPVMNPDASSADELTAVETLRGQPDMPEVLDIGPSFVQQAKDAGYLEAYKPVVWDEIPASLKGEDGTWVGSYYGVLAIATNATIQPNVPKTWADLKKPEYKGQVTINGDPREAGAAFAAVVAAALANGGSYDDIMPGIEYFAELKKLGNLQTIDVTEAAVLSGEVPIALDWTYNFPGLRPALEEAGFDFQVIVPSDGVYGGYYAQSVVTEAPHPCAARLWLNHLVSDEGALGYLEGGAIPARYAALLEKGLISDEIAANLPPAETIAAISFPTQEQTDKAKALITENWGPMVADQ
ncbi:MAG: extracellular solute-binding protein [Actinobacteria bacterium]|nr:extracellular solute-binding protein [Actinomycetota bacterium]